MGKGLAEYYKVKYEMEKKKKRGKENKSDDGIDLFLITFKLSLLFLLGYFGMALVYYLLK